MGSNADGNTAVKWKRDKQCSLVTLLTACCSCTDYKLCSIRLEMNQIRSFLFRIVLINTLCSVLTFTSVNLWGWGGDGDRSDGNGVAMRTEAMGMGWGWVQCSRGRAGMGSVSVPVQTCRVCLCRPFTFTAVLELVHLRPAAKSQRSL